MTAQEAATLARERFGEGSWVRGKHREHGRILCLIFGPDDREIARAATFEEAFQRATEAGPEVGK